MYIIGHYITSKLSGEFDADLLSGDDSPGLYLPDFARCHEWGYAHCFSMSGRDAVPRLVKAHLLGDWWIHYGNTKLQKRRGWAYKRMNLFASEYDSFWQQARNRGLLLQQTQRPDSVRGFSHTMMEYCVDTHLARKISYSDFEVIKSSLSTIGQDGRRWSKSYIFDLIDGLGVTGVAENIDEDIDSFADRVFNSVGPEEFAFRAAIKKFGLVVDRGSIEFIERFIDRGLRSLPSDEIDKVVEDAADFIGQYLN